MRVFSFTLPPAALAKVFTGLVVGAVALAAFLSFSVQPLVGRLLLPTQGGTATTWLGTMLFFQLALLLGYGWAAWLLQRRPLVQVAATVALSLAALVGSQLTWVAQSPWTGLDGVLLTLLVALLPAAVLLFSTGPLLHGWLRGRGQPVPYHLYALSNAGSLVALVAYPFTIERSLGLAEQMLFWRGLLFLLPALLGGAGWIFLRSGATAAPADETRETIPPARVGRWLGLSALTCLGMLGATHHLAAEIGASPLAWVGPFGAYLLSFVVTFSGVWQPRFTLAALGWLAISLTGFLLTKGVSNTTTDGAVVFWLLSLSAAGSFFGNGLLHAARPERRFAFFYLVLAAGGVLGGLFASVGAPFFFHRPSEFLAVSSVLLLIGLVGLAGKRDPLTVAVLIAVALAPVLGLVWRQTRDEAANSTLIRRFRNIDGYAMLDFREGAVILSSETTTHGSQLNADAASRRRPTLYYTESSGVGRLIEEAQKKDTPLNLGVVGLGAGTLAAYGRPGDTIDFWDIDEKALRLARDYFTYLADSPATIHVAQADGRRGLAAAKTAYDLIVLDAFSGDAIPPHLLTQEALALYFQRLAARQGLLAIHASNRYSKIFPIVGATAHRLGWVAVDVVTSVHRTTDTRDWDADGRPNQYILLCRPSQLPAVLAALPASEDDGRVERVVTTYAPQPPGRSIIWTDDRHAALDALDLRAWLAGH